MLGNICLATKKIKRIPCLANSAAISSRWSCWFQGVILDFFFSLSLCSKEVRILWIDGHLALFDSGIQCQSIRIALAVVSSHTNVWRQGGLCPLDFPRWRTKGRLDRSKGRQGQVGDTTYHSKLKQSVDYHPIFRRHQTKPVTFVHSPIIWMHAASIVYSIFESGA